MREEVLFHDPPDMPGLTAVAGRGLSAAFARHVHGAHVVGLVDAGVRVLEAGGVETEIAAGRLFAVAAGQGHRCRAGGGAPHSYRVLCLAPERLAPYLDGLDGAPPAFPCPLLDDPGAAGALDAFFALLPAAPHTLARREELAAAVARRLGIHARRGEPVRAEREAVRRALARIEADPAAPLSLGTLAATACLSPFHFQRAFTAQTGVSPRQWQLAARVRKARALLDRGVPPAEAALACGFADQSHFTRCFKRLVGVPPGRYARANAGRDPAVPRRDPRHRG